MNPRDERQGARDWRRRSAPTSLQDNGSWVPSNQWLAQSECLSDRTHRGYSWPGQNPSTDALDQRACLLPPTAPTPQPLPGFRPALSYQPGHASVPFRASGGIPTQPPGLPIRPPGLPARYLGLPTQPTGLPARPLGLPNQSPGLPIQPPGLPVRPPGLPARPPGLSIQHPGPSSQPPGLTARPTPVRPPGLLIQPPGLPTRPPGLTSCPTGTPARPPGLPTRYLGLSTQPLGLTAHPKPTQPPGLPTQPSGLLARPPGLSNQPPGLPNRPSGLPNQPSGLSARAFNPNNTLSIPRGQSIHSLSTPANTSSKYDVLRDPKTPIRQPDDPRYPGNAGYEPFNEPCESVFHLPAGITTPPGPERGYPSRLWFDPTPIQPAVPTKDNLIPPKPRNELLRALVADSVPELPSRRPIYGPAPRLAKSEPPLKSRVPTTCKACNKYFLSVSQCWMHDCPAKRKGEEGECSNTSAQLRSSKTAEEESERIDTPAQPEMPKREERNQPIETPALNEVVKETEDETEPIDPPVQHEMQPIDLLAQHEVERKREEESERIETPAQPEAAQGGEEGNQPIDTSEQHEVAYEREEGSQCSDPPTQDEGAEQEMRRKLGVTTVCMVCKRKFPSKKQWRKHVCITEEKEEESHVEA